MGYSLKEKVFITGQIYVKPDEKSIRALLSTYYIDVYFAFSETVKKEIYNVIVRIDELPLRRNSQEMIPVKEQKYVAPDVFNLQRDFQVIEICPITKELMIPHTVGSISMPIIFDISQNRPVKQLKIQASFAAEGNGLGFNKQGSKLTFDFDTGVQFLVVEKREVDFTSSGKTQNVIFTVEGDDKDYVTVCKDVQVKIVELPIVDTGVQVDIQSVNTTETSIKFNV